MTRPSVSIVVPVLDEQSGIIAAYHDLLKHCRDAFEIVFVDGGSTDKTLELLQECIVDTGETIPIRIVRSPAGRGQQMNRGGRQCGGDVLLFLHADTRLPPGALQMVRQVIHRGRVWGRFDVRLDRGGPGFRLIEFMMNLRSAMSGIATGDQAIFVRRDVFQMMGGFASQPLMEDIDFSRRLKTVARPGLIHDPVTTSARRWEEGGVVRTVLQMWTLRAAYSLGVSPDRLHRWYRDIR